MSNNNGLRMHILEAGFERPQRPCVLLLHGFPEIAYSWRHQFEGMARVCRRLVSVELVAGAGHWVAAEQPARFNELLLSFLQQRRSG